MERSPGWSRFIPKDRTQPEGRIYAGAGEKCEEEGEAERSHHGPTTVLNLLLPCTAWGGNEGEKLGLGRRRLWGEGFL